MDELSADRQADGATPIRKGDLLINPIKRTVTVGGQSVDLTAKEFDLLFHFAKAPGQVFNRTHLLDAVWGYGHDG